MCQFILQLISNIWNQNIFDWGNAITLTGFMIGLFQWKKWKKEEIEKMKMNFKNDFFVFLSKYIAYVHFIQDALKWSEKNKEINFLKLKILKDLKNLVHELSLSTEKPIIDEYYPELSNDLNFIMRNNVQINITGEILIDAFENKKTPKTIEGLPRMITKEECKVLILKLKKIYKKHTGKECGNGLCDVELVRKWNIL